MERAAILGLSTGHPVIRRAVRYLGDLLERRPGFPDPREGAKIWLPATRQITAASLSLVQPGHPAITNDVSMWSRIVQAAFAKGRFNAKRAADIAAAELSGLDVRCAQGLARWGLVSKYIFQLLGGRGGLLPVDIERAFLRYTQRRPRGIGYIGAPLGAVPDNGSSSSIERWLTSWELVSGFTTWPEVGYEAMMWLCRRQGQDGLWDLGPRASWGCYVPNYFPLSDDWRLKGKRRQDWTARALSLLGAYYAPRSSPG